MKKAGVAEGDAAVGCDCVWKETEGNVQQDPAPLLSIPLAINEELPFPQPGGRYAMKKAQAELHPIYREVKAKIQTVGDPIVRAIEVGPSPTTHNVIAYMLHKVRNG